jgi:hypothetical protein
MPTPDPAAERPSVAQRRSADLLGGEGSECRKWLEKRINAIVRGFEEQATRSDALDQWWRIYKCDLDDNQFYNGNAQVYLPIIRDAINARATRFANQLCPQTGRYVDVASSDGHLPWEIIALVDHYLRPDQDHPGFKTNVLRPLLVCGDIEGQYNLYIEWDEIERVLVTRRELPVEVDGMEVPPEALPEDHAPQVDLIEEVITDGAPGFEVLHDADVLVIPVTSPSLAKALASGGSATIVRRWSKDKYEAMCDADEIVGLARDGNGEVLTMTEDNLTGLQDLARKLARGIGIRAPSRSVVMFETWLQVPLDDEGDFKEAPDGAGRLCRLWWNLLRQPEGLRRNPYFNDRCPLLTSPVQRDAGVIKGQSLVEPLAPIQYEANDAANERADTDHYASMPIILRKPGMGNAPLILNLAAVWDVDPAEVKFAEFPDLSARARARIMDAMQIINTSLGVNPAMLPASTGRPGQKRNQAEVALEQSVDLLTVAEAVEVPDQNILTPAVAWIVDLDYQFRDRELTVRAFGELGLRAQTIEVPPLQNRTHYSFTWCGAQQVKQNVAIMQQGTAAINMARGLTDAIRQEGYQLRLGPLLERQFSAIFGGELGAQSLVDMRHQMSVDPDLENRMLSDGFLVPVHAYDDLQKHLAAHMRAKQLNGDLHGTFQVHIQEHMMQAAAQNAAQVAAMAGGQGMPGGAGPGVSGRPPGAPPPQPGAQPQPPRLTRGPPGMIAPEALPAAGGIVPPRRF